MTKIRARALTVIPLALLISGAVGFTVATVQIRQAEASVRSTSLQPLAPLSDMRIPAVAYPAYVSDAAMPMVKLHMGAQFGSLWLPRFKEHWALVEGTRLSDLRLGVGHVVNTALPGDLSNTVLAGHRETVFTHLGDLRVGDRVVLRTDAGAFTYRVVGTRIVTPTTVSVLAPSSSATLTLITCYPFVHYGPSPKRYIVTASLASAAPAVKPVA